MQTFLPHPSFSESAIVLDRARLGKQRVEAYQIIRTLTGVTSGWRNHPAVRMWNGHLPLLRQYLGHILAEWQSLGYRTSAAILAERSPPLYLEPYSAIPWWLGNEQFHAAHRSNLLRKDPVWYGQYGWTEPDNLPYLWPGSKPGEFRKGTKP